MNRARAIIQAGMVLIVGTVGVAYLGIMVRVFRAAAGV